MRVHRNVVRGAGFVAVCAALAITTSVLVAWALAACLPHQGLTRRFSLKFGPRGTDYCVRVYEYTRPGMVRRWWRIERGRAPASNSAVAHDHEKGVTRIESARVVPRGWGGLGAAVRDQEGATPEALEAAYGWPLPALWWRADRGFLPRSAERVNSGIPLSAPTATHLEQRSLPLMPAAPGLAADAAIYTGAWMAVLGGAWCFRNTIRRRRGWCPACAYDLRGDLAGGCPECGWARHAATPAG